MSFNNIPSELKQLNRWVCWRIEERNGKPTKVPKNPITGNNAMSSNPSTWSSFSTAIAAVQKFGFLGIGFMFNGDGLVGVDIDHCLDPDTGILNDTARDIITTMDSYTEYSQSGEGIHIICRGKLPEGKKRKGPVEMYETLRFFVMTGKILDDAHTDIEERTEQLQQVHKTYLFTEEKKKPAAAPVEINLSDDELIRKASDAKNGRLFKSLFDGDWKGLYNSQSEADMALCNMLAFWGGNDYNTIDRMFRRSGLFRDKWDERHGPDTYGNMTIAEAISKSSKVYTPRENKKPAVAPEPPQIDTGIDYLVNQEESLPDWITGPYNDMWNAERLASKYGKILKYNNNMGWLIWKGKYWEEDRQARIRILADEAIKDLYQFQDQVIRKYGFESKQNKSFYDWLCKSRNTGRKDNMIKETQNWEGICMLPEKFNSNIWLLNCRNGTVDLKTGRIYAHSKDDLITKMIDINYDSKAKAPTWDKFMDRIFDGNKALISFLQRSIGYSLTGSIKEQCIFILHGVGKNGKSTFLDTIRAMIGGGYSKNANSSVFMKSQGQQNLEEVARLQGARFVTTTEPEEGEKLAESFIKQATGGEPLTARHLYKSSFEYVPEFKVWMGTNHKPKISGSDLGIWRRIRLVPFSVIIPEEERDPDLVDKLKNELPGILNWAIEGCRLWQESGLKEPKEVLAATSEYRGEMDSLQVFLDECTEKVEGKTTKSGELYTVYEKWCTINGEYQLSSTKFSLKLKERGINKGRTRTMRTWEDIQLSPTGRRMLYGGTDKEEHYEQTSLPWEELK
ncbi:phage/plasmid primase, P4 family [Pseudobacteroides cellulosolvens]|uniref:Phage/plasmid primase, P4 family n=1 Tax=Pseudobacteroides cellulosolvens ATCC 35603 = DSM 2933 TaxID=398512 RepID=A0A0L6JG44_9FIRM|nr:phage/plasmid primase, P4 family [Pseudobacteroides cellulosolvens]KNY24826.1 phage/plasmid primase, P4 family [Pseudobacteroides cellulosolvens ATCC 35603 = DSM 2933]